MHKTNFEAKIFVNQLINELAGKQFKIVVCPPFVSIMDVIELTRGTNLCVGAQNCHFERSGAFTGEISPAMLKAIGVEFVIVGHSERRRYFNETDEMVNKKVKAVIAEGMRPIVCIGETKEEREKGLTFCVVESQLRQALYGLSEREVERVVIAYEPVWAIGTGIVARPEQAQEVHKFIRKLISDLYGAELAQMIPILYGGSIKPDNFFAIMAQPDVDGGLVGGASLDDQFVQLATIVQSFVE
ncbi:MAG: triose-phosphate isomerase [Pseudothermotoga sp.]|nr:triose-phosphate isomerase [Pseudothermotoga sp.]MCX7812946.1 triose-phosphate isomerase [Pseudothermotoga sp.]